MKIMKYKGKSGSPKKTVRGVSKKTGNPYSHPATKGTGRNKKVRTKVNKRTGKATYKPAKQPKMVTVKSSPRVKTTKRGHKVTKRKYGKKI